MESRRFPLMRVKQWTPDEVRAFVEEAKARGHTQADVARFAGCTVAALQHWMKPESGRTPTGAYRRALTLAEFWVVNDIEPKIEEESG